VRQISFVVEWLGFLGRSGRSLRFLTVQETVHAGERGFRVFAFQFCEIPSLVALGYTRALPGKTSFHPQRRPDHRLFPSRGGGSPSSTQVAVLGEACATWLGATEWRLNAVPLVGLGMVLSRE